MKKNTIIIVLTVLVVMFGLFGFGQKAKADQEAERTRLAEAEAVVQKDLAVISQHQADKQRILAVEQKQIAEVESIRAALAEAGAVRLQQQLEKCR